MMGLVTTFTSGELFGLPRLLCYLFGTVYPFLRSIKAVATPNLDDDVHWLTYWMVFSFLTLLDYVKETMSYIPIVGSVFGGIPYYYVFKLIFILYLINPAYTGAAHLANLIVPIITKWTSGLDKWEQQFEHFIVNNEFSKNMVKKIDNMDDTELQKALAKGLNGARKFLEENADKATTLVKKGAARALEEQVKKEAKRA